MEHQTEYGKVSTEELIRVYHMWKKMIKHNVERRNEFNQSVEGKELNRERAKKYYQEHRDEILAKRKAKYQNGVGNS
jgi:hypothetical protein